MLGTSQQLFSKLPVPRSGPSKRVNDDAGAVLASCTVGCSFQEMGSMAARRVSKKGWRACAW
eukprot:2464355-Alexandrium_andersonii.AAC.1